MLVVVSAVQGLHSRCSEHSQNGHGPAMVAVGARSLGRSVGDNFHRTGFDRAEKLLAKLRSSSADRRAIVPIDT